MRPGWDGEGTRTLILEALLELPLGASMREVAAHIGKHVNTVAHHIPRLRKSGQVQVVKRGWKKRRVVVPVRVGVSETEAEWLKLGTLTARAIVVVAREGKCVSSSQVARVLGWHATVARHHLQRARKAGILEARHGAGYTLVKGPVGPKVAGLGHATWQAVRHVAEAGRPRSSWEVARAHGWSVACAKYHLKRATQAGLLHLARHGPGAGYTATHNASQINWSKSNLAPA